jgi:type VI secretion system protein VasG
MLVAEPRTLLRKLDATCTRALERAASACIASRHYEVTVEHLLYALIDDPGSDVHAILEAFRVDPTHGRASLQRVLADLRSGNAGKPTFSMLLLEWVQDAWVLASTELGETRVRSGALFARLAASASRYSATDLPFLSLIPRDQLRTELAVLTSTSAESAELAAKGEGGAKEGEAPRAGSATSLGAPDGPLARYTSDLTQRAKDGHLDPVFGREPEIRQLVDILMRRRKNNPMIVGEAGVGKTALVEGLALRIAEGTVPAQLRDVALLSLDLGALQAGAGVKGEFEQRLKGVIQEVKSSPRPIVLFIDEAHTLIGAGGPQGGGDAANMLKPALARGELRTIAATTWAEFKRYFEKDAALERRFQPVKVDEPSIEVATLMLRGVARRFEESHGVVIQDEAVSAAVELSSRYLAGRQLPDKAVDLLDTSASRVKVLRAAPPAVLEDARAQLAGVERELEALLHDEKAGIDVEAERRVRLEARKAELQASAAKYEQLVTEQLAIVARIDELRAGDASLRPQLREQLELLRAIKREDLLVHADVDEKVVAAVISDWTGIPAGKMVKDDVKAILELEDRLRLRVRGQDPALAALGRELRAARSDLKSPNTPLGVFLLVGPSGVGKTETALGLADVLFGGERFIVTINMSEFQERHTVSRLIGSPPGYVGYGEGGVLTEAVRQRPYSVVLLDEVEKADREVLNLFYQVFDKGMLSDGEGRVIDFKNTVVVMTSNLATQLITDAAPPGSVPPSSEDLVSLVKPTLSAHFKPALLARMTVVPYVPIGPEALASIARMKLDAIARRAQESHGIELVVDDAVVKTIADRCREVDSGARNVDHILRGTVLPMVSMRILESIADEKPASKLRLSLDEHSEIVCEALPA